MERKQLNREYLQKTLESRIQADLGADVLSGAALTVTQDGQTLWEGCFGTARSDSLFRLASMTKPITAAAGLVLSRPEILRRMCIQPFDKGGVCRYNREKT